MDIVQQVEVYALDDGKVDTERTETEVLRTPSFEAIAEMGEAGVEIWDIMAQGVIPVDRRILKQLGLGIAACLVDSQDAATAARDGMPFGTYEWQRAIRKHMRRMIASDTQTPKYYETLNKLLNSAFEECPKDDSGKAPAPSTSESGE